MQRQTDFAAGIAIALVVSASGTGVAAPVLLGEAIFAAQIRLGPESQPAFFETDGPNFVGADVSGAVRQTLFGLPADASGSASADPSPSLAAVVTADAQSSRDTALGIANASFHFSVVQTSPTPVPVASVPLDVGGFLSASVGASGFVDAVNASATIDIPSLLPLSVEGACVPQTLPDMCDPDVFEPFRVQIDVNPGQDKEIFLSISALADSETGGGNANASATADPTITIDPGFPFKDHFDLVFSPNLVAPISSVPEPPSWTLVLSGLSIIGLFAMRAAIFSRTT
jgi:hypothetical protein